MQRRNVSPLTYSPASCVQPRTVAGFRGTVRYASVNAHKNKVGAALASSLTRLDLDSCGSTPEASNVVLTHFFLSGNGSP